MIAAALGAATVAAPAVAQVDLNNSQGLVNVTVDDVSVLNNFLNETQLAALNNVTVPIIVQVPVGVAANVCNVSAAVLGQSRATGGGCTAESGSNALARAVTEQTLTQKYKKNK
jgi:hypothetical protein